MRIQLLLAITFALLLITACTTTSIELPASSTARLTNEVKRSVSTILPSTRKFTPDDGYFLTQTKTPRPTSTPRPTNTLTPTKTHMPEPGPVVFNGSRDSVIDMTGYEETILHITYIGSESFKVWAVSPYNRESIVDTIGSYEGTVPFQQYDGDYFTIIEIKTIGSWEVQALPYSMMRQLSITDTITGSGDDFIKIKGGIPSQLFIDASNAKGDFAVWLHGRGGAVLLVEEFAPYTGTVVVPDNGFYIGIYEIHAMGDWSIIAIRK